MTEFTAALVNAHGMWRYVILIMAGVTVGRMFMGWLRQDRWRMLETRLGAFLVTAVDVGIALGLIVWLLQARWSGADLLRSWRHPALMLAAAVVLHYGWWRVRQSPTMPCGMAVAYSILSLPVLLF
ncbi:MAG: hypothetical protein R2932_10930 [Caldilineaceae bacterium]